MLAKRFSDYEGLAQWVRDQGYDISEDSLWRYGKSLKQESTAIRLSLLQARMLARSFMRPSGEFASVSASLTYEPMSATRRRSGAP